MAGITTTTPTNPPQPTSELTPASNPPASPAPKEMGFVPYAGKVNFGVEVLSSTKESTALGTVGLSYVLSPYFSIGLGAGASFKQFETLTKLSLDFKTWASTVGLSFGVDAKAGIGYYAGANRQLGQPAIDVSLKGIYIPLKVGTHFCVLPLSNLAVCLEGGMRYSVNSFANAEPKETLDGKPANSNWASPYLELGIGYFFGDRKPLKEKPSTPLPLGKSEEPVLGIDIFSRITTSSNVPAVNDLREKLRQIDFDRTFLAAQIKYFDQGYKEWNEIYSTFDSAYSTLLKGETLSLETIKKCETLLNDIISATGESPVSPEQKERNETIRASLLSHYLTRPAVLTLLASLRSVLNQLNKAPSLDNRHSQLRNKIDVTLTRVKEFLQKKKLELDPKQPSDQDPNVNPYESASKVQITNFDENPNTLTLDKLQQFAASSDKLLNNYVKQAKDLIASSGVPQENKDVLLKDLEKHSQQLYKTNDELRVRFNDIKAILTLVQNVAKIFATNNPNEFNAGLKTVVSNLQEISDLDAFQRKHATAFRVIKLNMNKMLEEANRYKKADPKNKKEWNETSKNIESVICKYFDPSACKPSQKGGGVKGTTPPSGPSPAPKPKPKGNGKNIEPN